MALKGLGTVIVPLILLGLAALDVFSAEAGVRSAIWVLVVTLGVIGHLAVVRLELLAHA